MKSLVALILLLATAALVGCEKTIHEARGSRVQPEQLASRK